eukprot:6103931-Amphidinium_carterae.1
MASGDGKHEKGEHEATHGSRPQVWANYTPGKGGRRSRGSASSGYGGYGDQWNTGDQWSMANGWHSMPPWTMANAWSHPASAIASQGPWGMSSGWSTGGPTMDPLAVIQGSMSYGQAQQWQTMSGSTASGSGDQWSTRAWTSQDATRSWSAEATESSKRVPPPPPPPPRVKKPSESQDPTVPPPGGPSAGGGNRTIPNPKKPADNAWRNTAIDQIGVPYPDSRGMKSRPYEPDGRRPYPALEEYIVVYRSEMGNGSYPLSCVPVLSDVLGDPDGFPKDLTWLRTREIRRRQERKVFFQGTGYRDPDVTPTRKVDEFRDRPEPPWYDYQF